LYNGSRPILSRAIFKILFLECFTLVMQYTLKMSNETLNRNKNFFPGGYKEKIFPGGTPICYEPVLILLYLAALLVLFTRNKDCLYFSGSCIPTNENLFILSALHWHRQYNTILTVHFSLQIQIALFHRLQK
jgi:hypothetical protein